MLTADNYKILINVDERKTKMKKKEKEKDSIPLELANKQKETTTTISLEHRKQGLKLSNKGFAWRGKKRLK